MAMLKSYSVSNKKKGDYKVKFKVEKGVRVTFKEVDGINEVHLNYDTDYKSNRFRKKYKPKGKLEVVFVQHHAPGCGKGDGDDDPIKKPIIIVDGGD